METGTLYLVATPIGNWGDITPRALEVLRTADIVAAEDTRNSGNLLRHFDIRAELVSYHDHNEQDAAPKLIENLRAGKNIALVSDAGTPLISDPGYRIVAAAIAAEILIVPLPGANAILPALQLSGLPPHPFYFGGFLPPKSKARQNVFADIKTLPATLIFYEAPHRIAEALADASAVLGDDRQAAVVREISKKFEEARRDTLNALAKFYSENEARGEIVLVIAGAAKDEKWDEDMVRDALSRALESGGNFRDAVAITAAESHWPKREVYDMALKLKG